MSSNIRVKVDRAMAIEAVSKINAVGEEARTEIRVQTSRSARNIERKAKLAVSVDTGVLRGSIQPQFFDDGMTADIGTNIEYAPFVEFGRLAGRMPPPDALEGWARRHGMAGEEFMIARAIGRFGVKERPFLIPAYESEKSAYLSSVRKILAGLGR